MSASRPPSPASSTSARPRASPAASARVRARRGRAGCPCPSSCAAARARASPTRTATTYVDYVMGQGPLILGHRPPGRHRGDHARRCASAARCSRSPTTSRAEAAGGGHRADAVDGAPAVRQLRHRVRPVRAAVRPRVHRPREDPALRGPLPRLVGRDPLVGPPGPGRVGARPTRRPPCPGSTGMPAAVAETLHRRRRGTTSPPLERIFAEHGYEIAAVITEPILGNCGGIMPAPGYLERMRELATEHGAVLIFDEVLTGMRVASGGAQDLFGIRPDLTVLAKALGAGVPVAAVGGRREIMEMVIDGRTMHGGTYNSNPLVCSAVIATAGVTGAAGLLRRARGARPAARRRPGRASRATRASRRAGAAPARCSSSGSPPSRRATTGRRTTSSPEPVPDALRRAARARRPDPAAAGGAVPPVGRRTPTPTSTARSRRRPRRCRPWRPPPTSGDVGPRGGVR